MLLQLENVKKRYPSFSLECSLDLKEGTITGIIGQNGAGKSTMFKSILDLIFIDEGKIEIFGKDSKTLDCQDREQIGNVFSESGFSKYLTVQDIIPVMDATFSKFNKNAFKEECIKFSIPLDKKLKEFSTGMYAKLKLLLSMSYGAKLLILDEPTVGLDVMAREELLDMLRNYMDDEKGILISSHIASDLEGLCDDIYMMHNGTIVLHEETDVLLSEYGVLKLTEEQYQTVEQSYILKAKKEAFGWRCLTNQKQFYQDNCPDIIIERGNIDDTITLMITGTKGGAY